MDAIDASVSARIEKEIKGKSADERRAVRSKRARRATMDGKPSPNWHRSPKRHTLAMLLRRKDEIFRQLLARLDLAIASTTIDDVYVDEVNAPQN